MKLSSANSFRLGKCNKICRLGKGKIMAWFSCVCSTSLLKTRWEKEKLLITSTLSFFPTVFTMHLENFIPFSTNLKLLSANSELKLSKICHLGRGKYMHFYKSHTVSKLQSHIYVVCSLQRPHLSWVYSTGHIIPCMH